MWCENCRSDVAAEVSADNRLVHCATCGGHIATPMSTRAPSRTQQARELLERWSRDRTHDPDTMIPQPHYPETRTTTPQMADSLSAETRPKRLESIAAIAERSPEESRESARPSRGFRMSAGENMSAGEKKSADTIRNEPRESARESVPEPSGGRRPDEFAANEPTARNPTEFRPQRYDTGHTVAAPHASFVPKPESAEKPPLKWVPLVGQSLAYVGVLGLMLGTCLVILGYFRGPATYAPTGWLITMAGQMLLFLGVVTLVSSGMEETTNTVANRIDRLNEKLVRIEQSTDVLRGPRGNQPDLSREHQPESKAG